MSIFPKNWVRLQKPWWYWHSEVLNIKIIIINVKNFSIQSDTSRWQLPSIFIIIILYVSRFLILQFCTPWEVINKSDSVWLFSRGVCGFFINFIKRNFQKRQDINTHFTLTPSYTLLCWVYWPGVYISNKTLIYLVDLSSK